MRIPLLERSDVHEFRPLLAEIEERPVSPMGRFILIVIVNTILFFVLWMYFGKIDIVISARGTVMAEGENKILQPLDTGVVSKILVKEGSIVHKGQALMEINPSTTQPELYSTDANLRHAKLEIERIHATLGESGFSPRQRVHDPEAIETQRQLYEAAVNGLQRQIAAKEAEFQGLSSQIEDSRLEQTKNAGLLAVAQDKEEQMSAVLDIVARDDVDKVKNDILTYGNNSKQAEQKIEQLIHQQSQIREEIEKIRHDFHETHLKDLNEKETSATDLGAKLKELTFKNSKQMIISPVDGTVDEIFIHTVGGVVTPAEKLLSIVPAQSPLIVKAQVENQDIGFVEPGQPVSIKVDTFEFQKYGMFDGKVKLISKDSHENEHKKEDEQKRFDVYVTPITKSIMVEGRKEPLKAGMTVAAEVKVGKRRIIEFFIYPLIKYWHEGMSVR